MPHKRRVYNSTSKSLASPRGAVVSLALLAGVSLQACSNGMEQIDARAEQLVRQVTDELGGDATPPRWDRSGYREGEALRLEKESLYRPPTINPNASEIQFVERSERIEAEAGAVAERLQSAEAGTDSILKLDLRSAIQLAMRNARDYQSAEEDYILSALRLLVERHLWGPRFFDDISATVSGRGSDDQFDTALRLVNTLSVTQRLPYGGEVSARLLANATEDLHQRVAGEEVQDAEVILSANLPLLRGAGLAATNSRIQAERNLVYAARSFERFRRQFFVDIASEFLNLVVQHRSIENAEMQLKRLQAFEDRARSLLEAGRDTPVSLARASQDVLFQQDSLQSSRESYALALDRFKVRLNLPVETQLEIIPSSLNLPVPEVDVNEAIRLALSNRLDLQTRRDQLDDSFRAIDVAANDLLPDLDLSGSVSVPTDPELARSGLQFKPGESSFNAAVALSLPLDREIERIQLRQAQIAAERAQREYERFRDTLVIEVRDAVREIRRAQFSIEIQKENIRVAELGLDAINLAPDRYDANERSDAADRRTRAQDQYDSALRDLEVAILEYLEATDTLRVRDNGSLSPLAGMTLGFDEAGQSDEMAND